MLDQILIVIVLYKTKLANSLTLKTLQSANKELGHILSVFIHDNSPECNPEIDQLQNINIVYNADYSNSGISKAYNNAAELAKNDGKKWMLLLDQDSELPTDFLSKINLSLIAQSDQALFVPILKYANRILSPCNFKFGKGTEIKNMKFGLNSLKDKSLFNSGLLIKLSSFFAAGGYNEKVKLDFSDHSFIHRLKKIEDSFILMPIEIEHQFSTFSNNKETILRRFEQYCIGVVAYYRFEDKSIPLIFWLFLRCLKLLVQFKDIKVLNMFINGFKRANNFQR